MNMEQKVEQAIDRLIHYIEDEHFRGWDPYDALNSPILWYLSFGSKWIRIAYTQALKICPINFRKVLFIKKGYNPKGLGLFLSGYVQLYKVFPNNDYQKTIYELIGLLKQLKSPNMSGASWGYNFPWQNRNGYSPLYRPTSVNTSFIGRAFIDTYEVMREKKCLDIARSSCDFVLKDLNIIRETETELILSYNTADGERIYNSNMLCAAFLARVYAYTKEKHLLSAAEKITNYVINGQRSDGSWYYGENKNQYWIDLHHTAYVLESLYEFSIAAERDDLKPIIQKGLDYCVNTFFWDNGRPKLWHNKDYPTDIHAMAAVIALVKLKALHDHETLIEKIVVWMIDHMQDRKGYFYYRIGKWIPNRIPYMRWSQAWALLALTTYLHHLKEKNQQGYAEKEKKYKSSNLDMYLKTVKGNE